MTTTDYIIDKAWGGYNGEDIHFEGIIKIDDDVIKQVDDEWRQMFYSSVVTPQDVAEHIAFNMIVNDVGISMLDGFANFQDGQAKILC